MILHNKIDAQLPEWRNRVVTLLKESGDVVAGEVTISQIYGGMRSVKALVTDISFVDPNEGIRFRGHTLPVVLEKLPKHEVIEAMELAVDRLPGKRDQAVKYFCGICWRKIKGD